MSSSPTSALPSPAPDVRPTPYHVVDKTTVQGQTHRIKLCHHERFLAAILFSTDYPTHFRLKPEIFPLCTPSGIPVTASHEYCFIHHQSVMAGHGKVAVAGRDKPIDFYRELPHPDPGREDAYHSAFNLFTMGPSGIQRIVDHACEVDPAGIRVRLTLDWQTREVGREHGDSIIREARTIRFRVCGHCTVIDLISTLRPTDAAITLMPDRHTFMGVRVHDLIDPEDGGTVRDAMGRVNATGFFGGSGGKAGPAARWVDYSGPIGPNPVGVTLIAHPRNLRNDWYVTPFGLMQVSAMLHDPVPLEAGQPFHFATRILAHDGPMDDATANEWADEFAAHPIHEG